jgi:hypothetical protein
MGRPRNERRSRVRVEFSLPPALADAVYTYAAFIRTQAPVAEAMFGVKREGRRRSSVSASSRPVFVGHR